MFKRIILIVLDSVGIGELPDAKEYGDEGAATLPNIAEHTGGLHLPVMDSLGLSRIHPIAGLSGEGFSGGAYGKMAEKSQGKDTITGHWEMAGIILETPFNTYPQGFPSELIAAFEARIGRATLANRPASGTEIIAELGKEHMRTGFPIVYTSADSVFQIAAHEEIVPVEQLYEFCRVARQLCVGEYLVARVIARPFVGQPGSFVRTERRKDFAVDPPYPTVLQDLTDAEIRVSAIGKIEDIFVHKGITDSVHTGGNEQGMAAILDAMGNEEPGLIFANLVDFDMKYGHRLDVKGYAKALQEFDQWLPSLQQTMKKDDLLIITADHGCDPTTEGTDHTREYVPLLVWSPDMNKEIKLGVRASFADVGQSIIHNFQLPERNNGESFLPLLKDYERL